MIKMENWYYYNHAMLPKKAPHEEADTSVIIDGTIWNNPNKPLLARWTTDFDCGYETNWWFCIKDDLFDIKQVNAKKRYEINKGLKNFETRVIEPIKYLKEMYDVQVKAYSSYPKKYRPDISFSEFEKNISGWNKDIVIGAFCKESNSLMGYTQLIVEKTHITFSIQRVMPEAEKRGINAALVYAVIDECAPYIEQKKYIVDGERNIAHETSFQNYLERYFQFRKAYCKLNIAYSPKVKTFINILYPFKRILKKFDGINIVHKINSILDMEEIIRKQKL